MSRKNKKNMRRVRHLRRCKKSKDKKTRPNHKDRSYYIGKKRNELIESRSDNDIPNLPMM